LVIRSISNISTIIKSISGHSTLQAAQQPETSPEFEAERRQDADFALKLLEKMTASLSGTVSRWYSDGTPAVITRDTKTKAVTSEISTQLASLTGIELKDAKEVEDADALKKELEKYKAMFHDAVLTVDNQRFVIEEMRQELVKSRQEPAETTAAVTQAIEKATLSFRDEVKNLQEAISSLTKERDEALKSLADQSENEESKQSTSSIVAATSSADAPSKTTRAEGPLPPLPKISFPEVQTNMKVGWLQPLYNHLCRIAFLTHISSSLCNGRRFPLDLFRLPSGEKLLKKHMHLNRHLHHLL
jgi:hypothetical protein